MTKQALPYGLFGVGIRRRGNGDNHDQQQCERTDKAS